MKGKIKFTGLTLLLILMFAGLSAISDNAVSGQVKNILPKLLINSEKITTLNLIAEHGGKVYAAGFLRIPGWNPVPGVSIYTGGFAIIGDSIIYKRPFGTGSFPAELYRSNLKGGAETVITRDIDSSGSVWAAGNRIIYAGLTEKPDYGPICSGVFWYDVKTSKITRLLGGMSEDEFFSLVSFDDDFVYYQKKPSKDVWRISWNGTKHEVLKGVIFPEDFHKVEGEYYYCSLIDYDTNKTKISRYSISDGKPKGAYTIDATSLIALKGGWAYFGNETGIYKTNMNTGKKVKLADLPPNVRGWFFGFLFGEGAIIGDSIYFSAYYEEEDNSQNTRLYKVPIDGGKMEYQNAEWYQS